MSAGLRPKCPQCGSYYLSTLEGEKKRKCIDCKLEFKTDDKQVVVNNRIKNTGYPFQSCGYTASAKDGMIDKVEKFNKTVL